MAWWKKLIDSLTRLLSHISFKCKSDCCACESECMGTKEETEEEEVENDHETNSSAKID